MSSSPSGSPAPVSASHRWLRAELDRLDAQHPRVHRAVRALWLRPVPFVIVLSVLAEGALGAVISGGDAAWFRDAGVDMVGPGFLDVFSQSGLQIGPLYLLALGLATRVLEALGLPVLFTLAAAQAAGVAWFALWTARRVAQAVGAAVLPVQWALGLTLALGGFLAEGIGNGHPEEILIGLLLANAALVTSSGRHALAGLLVGLATGVKQWGIIGAGILVHGRRLRGTVVGSLVVAGVVAAVYLPFALGGEMNTFDMAWGIPDSSLLATIAGWTGGSDWTLRLVQGAAAGLVGTAIAWRRRGSPLVAIIGVISTRLLLDPLRLTYYSGPLVAVGVLWMWTSDIPVVRRWRLAVTLCMPAVVLAPYLLPRPTLWHVGDVLLLLVPVACLVVEARAGRSRMVGDDLIPQVPATTLPPCPTPAAPPLVRASS
ncbi:glycosyltransferase 87 family protein [Cellulomonas terrae]|uniref:DUF2029 domain-containing protein n=1 Tax=Cellulomonas terrae TaxID=311234 RepID=A0A511JH45_9CELL|nr:glycosyltransferase 87 family protein [Cellulomonas terrae]GEL97159.1 hypothetical protein CTE05_07060 [Cellulomonas terrae]